MADRTVWLASQAGRLDEMAELPPQMFDRVTLKRALYVAVANDHAGIVSFLLRAWETNKNAQIIMNTGIPHLAVNIAARHDSADALRALIEAKVDVNAGSRSPAVIIAVQKGATACVRVLVLAKANLSATNDNGVTPVCAAAHSGDINILHLLLQHKASAVMREPIVWAAQSGHVGAVYVLIMAKARIDAADSNGNTPLYAAANHGHVGIMLLLLQAKADATHSRSGWSALSAAASAGHTAAVRCLLQHAPALATVVTREVIWCANVKFAPGSTPLDIARRFQRVDADVIALLVAATSSQ